MRWGILATGTIAEKFARTIRAMEPEGELLAAVGSRSIESAERFARDFGVERAYGSYEALAADPQIDAVYIATPNNLHFANASLCLNSGKHVLCEKPFTTNADDAAALYRLAEEKGLFAMEAFWTRFLPIYDELLRMIREQTLGELRHVRCGNGFVAQGARRERKLRADLGGGALLDIGIYNLGFLRALMGADPERFTSEVRMSEYGTDEFSAMLLRYPGGRTAQTMQAIGIHVERQAALFFDNGAVYLPDFHEAHRMTVKPNGGEAYDVERLPRVNGFEYEIREVARCVREGKSHSDIFTPEDSVAVLRLMDDIRKSWNMRFPFE